MAAITLHDNHEALALTLYRERLLLVLVSAFLGVNTLALALVGIGGTYPLLHFGGWVASAWGGHVILNRALPRRDPLLFPLMMFFAGWGLLLIDRLAPIFADRQTVWVLVATAAFCLTVRTPTLIVWLRQYRYVLLVLGLGLLVSTIVLGRNPSGLPGAPELWLGVGNVFFQPSEALKLILVAFLASYLSEQYPLMRLATAKQGGAAFWSSPRVFGPLFLMWSLCVVVLVWQRDLGTAALFFLVFLTLLYLATGKWWIVASGLGLVAIAGYVAYQLFAVVQLRVDIWLNPWVEANGRAYQIVQSLMAVANGGIFGQGIGQGAPTYIPVVHSDFVFAALAEEWGLVGVVVLLGGFAVLMMRGLLIATRHDQRPFKALLAAGITTSLSIQMLMIVAGVLKLVPLTGVTVPFVSYGGSSLLMSFVMMGILVRLSSEAD